jgi:hypothetical protein
MQESIKIEEKVRVFEQEYRELLEKHSLEMKIDIDFPQYKILPSRVQLALQVLFDEGVQYRTSYREKK